MLYSHSGFGGLAPNEGQRRFIYSTDSYLELQARLRPLLAAQSAQQLGLCFHSLRAVTSQQISEVLAASDPQCPVHIHIAEQQKEVDDCLSWSGRRPLQWLYENTSVDNRWCLVHATHADADEVQLMAQSGAVAGLCLTTEANLGDGIFPAVDYIAQGGRWGIGSDSHVSLSVVEELRWLEYGQRLRDQRRNRLYRSDQPWSGKLQAGQRADWLVLDGNGPMHRHGVRRCNPQPLAIRRTDSRRGGERALGHPRRKTCRRRAKQSSVCTGAEGFAGLIQRRTRSVQNDMRRRASHDSRVIVSPSPMRRRASHDDQLSVRLLLALANLRVILAPDQAGGVVALLAGFAQHVFLVCLRHGRRA